MNPRERKFLMTEKQQDLTKYLVDISNLSQYNIANYGIGSVYADLRSVPEMLRDPIIASSLALIMETAFQMDGDQNVFVTKSKYDLIKRELDDFHTENNFQQLCLDIGYNLLLWGNLPFEHQFEKGKLIGVKICPDFTKIIPIVISGILVGYMVDNEYKYPYEYTFGQLQYFKNYGGITRSQSILTTSGNNQIENEFVVAPSYLSASAKSWRNIQIIEDALLLARMDQSNYYRILSVDVGGSVTSKSAIKVLNYYRNLFKKVRRVSYDPTGMAARGTGQQFEVIIPKTGSGVEVKDVGGQLEIKALADLEKQYQKLFASLRVQPSMIGFSSEVPNTLGNTPMVLWDQRFAKTCKTIVYSALRTIKSIDRYYLLSRGYNVKDTDWSYSTICSSVLEESERADNISKAVENYQKISTELRNNEVNYNKEYLVKSVLGSALGASGIDIDELLRVEGGEKKEIVAANTNLLGFTERQAEILVKNQVLTSDEAKNVTSGKKLASKKLLTSGKNVVDFQSLNSEYMIVSDDTEIDLTDVVEVSPVDSSTVLDRFGSKKAERLVTVPVSFPINVTNDVDLKITRADLAGAYTCLDQAVGLPNGSLLITSKKDLCNYLCYYLNSLSSCIIDKLWESK